MADILKQYERQTVTDPLEAQALELIGLAEKAKDGSARDNAALVIDAPHIAPAIARAYLEARAEIERLGQFIYLNCDPAQVRTEHEPIIEAILKKHWGLDPDAALHPQPDTSDKGARHDQ